AMRRKNWSPNERDMGVVVPIHNAVNEECWRRILEWEAMHERYKLPFDRHDWTVDRCGKQVTYVIDFYGGAPQAGSPVSFFIDVRPSLTMGGLIDRCKMLWRLGRWQ
ncbi:hypothetical protein HK405_002881, partial [Cladochytrium tenue]